MNWLGALGGIGQGVSQGIQDWERMDEAKARKEEAAFLKTQRDRMQRQQTDEDALDAAGKHLDPNSPEYYKEMARSAQQRGLTKKAAEFARQGEEAGDRATKRKQEQFLQGMLQARRLARTDPAAAAEAAAKAYELVNDGHKAIVDREAGTIGMAAPSGKWMMAPRPINQQGVMNLINEGLEFASPDMMKFFADTRDKSEGRQIQREGNVIQGRQVDNQGTYQQGMLGIYGARNALDQKEFDAKNAGGMFTRQPTAADLFQPLGLSDDGKRVVGRVGGNLVEREVPDGYSKLFPKVTGDKAQNAKFVKSAEDGTHTAYDNESGRPLFNVLPDGREAPLGLTGSGWATAQNEAKKRGVRAMLGKDGNGKPVLAYVGKDKVPYDTIEEAAKAKAKSN